MKIQKKKKIFFGGKGSGWGGGGRQVGGGGVKVDLITSFIHGSADKHIPSKTSRSVSSVQWITHFNGC